MNDPLFPRLATLHNLGFMNLLTGILQQTVTRKEP